jgi:hypothetical protein
VLGSSPILPDIFNLCPIIMTVYFYRYILLLNIKFNCIIIDVLY